MLSDDFPVGRVNHFNLKNARQDEVFRLCFIFLWHFSFTDITPSQCIVKNFLCLTNEGALMQQFAMKQERKNKSEISSREGDRKKSWLQYWELKGKISAGPKISLHRNSFFWKWITAVWNEDCESSSAKYLSMFFAYPYSAQDASMWFPWVLMCFIWLR